METKIKKAVNFVGLLVHSMDVLAVSSATPMHPHLTLSNPKKPSSFTFKPTVISQVIFADFVEFCMGISFWFSHNLEFMG